MADALRYDFQAEEETVNYVGSLPPKTNPHSENFFEMNFDLSRDTITYKRSHYTRMQVIRDIGAMCCTIYFVGGFVLYYLMLKGVSLDN